MAVYVLDTRPCLQQVTPRLLTLLSSAKKKSKLKALYVLFCVVARGWRLSPAENTELLIVIVQCALVVDGLVL